ncbi:MAG TPA: HAMP domain-containing sensor histidine kinase [Vicinamibacteria bacterium]|jgi:signal transduction histidine kinase
MRRLYLHVYAGLVATLLAFALTASALWHFAGPAAEDQRLLDGLGTVMAGVLPPADAPRAEQAAALRRLGGRVPGQLALYDGEGALLASNGAAPAAPDPRWTESRWMRGRGGGPTAALRLPDGRWLMVRHGSVHAVAGLGTLALLGLAIAGGGYLVARRVTRRLERLQRRVEALGRGDLRARVEVEGNDEVADLARSFNQAAERIERLVSAQRGLLAGASHELRSPLARIRVALELLADGARPELKAELARDIGELDELIGELLLASRLDAVGLERREDVDLLALLAEEAARGGALVKGDPVRVKGDPRMLRRLIRNLLENAERYGGGAAVEASVQSAGAAGALLRVADRGPGVSEGERERIFEPFYRSSRAGESERASGLGLALVRQIARHHGGEARCVPREGGGTCFEVQLG